MKKFLMIGAAFAAFAPAAAMAQDAGSWTGAHADVVGGWDQVKVKDGIAPGVDYSKDGVVYGGGLGYDYDTGSVVLGVDAELTGSTVKDCETITTTTYCLKAGRDIYAGARVGVAVGDARDTLLYFKGGYTNARSTADTTVGTTTTSFSSDEDGYRVGAGIEHKFSDSMSAKVEYRYSDYGDGFHRNQVVAGLGFRF
ncbi:outer membrane protein [Novosphingobium aquiterrae]|uniref:Outer membrane protein n=1 Tax=Novosphingobium aquiterrae TaxID=624388 RepID=A0ABV6PDH0_9SPHN